MRAFGLLRYSAGLWFAGALALSASEGSKLLTNNFDGAYFGVNPEESGLLETPPWEPSGKTDYTDRCLDTGATYTYPEGAPNYHDSNIDRRDPDRIKLLRNNKESVIWTAKRGARVVEVDLKEEYLIDRIAVHSSLWSAHYALNFISLYRMVDGEWEQIGNDIEGYESHRPEGGVEYYYLLSEPLNVPAQHLRIALRNDEEKMIGITGIEVWGKPQ